MTPEVLLLDLDGTLIDWVGAMTQGIGAAAAEMAGEFGLDAREVAEHTLAFEHEVFDTHAVGWTLGGVGVAEFYPSLWRRALDEFGLAPDPAERLARTHWAAEKNAFRTYDDVDELLAAAAASGIRTALVTNGPGEVQRAKLAQVGLTDSFAEVVISAEHGIAKPDPDIFRRALVALDVEPVRAWHVGDSLEYDIAGAQAAGIDGIWINRNGWDHGRHQPSPAREITGFSELVPLLSQAA